MAAADGKQIFKSYQTLSSSRQALNQTWANCYEFTYPLRGEGFLNDSDPESNFQAGKTKISALRDTTSTDSVRLLASSILSSMTPSSGKWFNLVIKELVDNKLVSHADRVWLEQAADKVHSAVHTSNYDAQALEFFLDVCIAGMAALYVRYKEGVGLIFEAWPMNTVFAQDTMRNGHIDTVYKVWDLTPADAVSKFQGSTAGAKGTVPDKVMKEFDKDPYSPKTFRFIQCIRPRLDRLKKPGVMSKDLPYQSVYVFADSKEVVYESGYNEFPVMVPRWMNIPGTDNGIGPILDALPDIQMLSQLVELIENNTEMQVTGMYGVVDDGTFNPRQATFGPGQVWLVSDPIHIPKQIATGGDVGSALSRVSPLQEQIRKILLADQLAPTAKKIQTAAEIYQRDNLVRQALGPIFSRLQSEFLQPFITRVFGLMYRAGKLGVAPQTLMNGTAFNISYTSPLARAQRQADVQAIREFKGSLSQDAQMNPTALDVFDFDKAERLEAELLGVPTELVRDEKATRKVREDRAAAQEAQAQAEAQAQQGGGMSPDQMLSQMGG